MPNDHEAHARLFSIVAVSRTLGVSRNTVFTLLRTGKLGFVRIGRRRLIPETAIDKFIAANLVLASAATARNKNGPSPSAPTTRTKNGRAA